MIAPDGALTGDAAAIRRSLTEPERFTIVFDRHAPHVHRYLARRVGRHVADDLVAETFLTAFRKRARYDLARPDARPWLYGIATHLVAQHRREEHQRLRLAARLGEDRSGLDQIDRLAHDATAKSLRALLCEALLDLTSGDRDVVLLIGCEELTYEEASHALGIPVGTVRSRMNRARRQLREALAAVSATTKYEEILNDD